MYRNIEEVKEKEVWEKKQRKKKRTEEARKKLSSSSYNFQDCSCIANGKLINRKGAQRTAWTRCHPAGDCFVLASFLVHEDIGSRSCGCFNPLKIVTTESKVGAAAPRWALPVAANRLGSRSATMTAFFPSLIILLFVKLHIFVGNILLVCITSNVWKIFIQ